MTTAHGRLGWAWTAAGMALAASLLLPWFTGTDAIALTIWMLPRGDRNSGYDLGPGPFVALAVAFVVLGTAIWRRRA